MKTSSDSIPSEVIDNMCYWMIKKGIHHDQLMSVSEQDADVYQEIYQRFLKVEHQGKDVKVFS